MALLVSACASPEGISDSTPAPASSTAVVAQTAVVPPVEKEPTPPPKPAPTFTPAMAEEPSTSSGTGEANADVIFVLARQESDDSWHFAVTVEHPDTGWDDYADGWDVLLPDGTVVLPDPDSPFTRLLLHPHESEQPFTRTQGGIIIPPRITQVTVRAHDLVDGFGGREITLDMGSAGGQQYEVQRLGQ